MYLLVKVQARILEVPSGLLSRATLGLLPVTQEPVSPGGVLPTRPRKGRRACWHPRLRAWRRARAGLDLRPLFLGSPQALRWRWEKVRCAERVPCARCRREPSPALRPRAVTAARRVAVAGQGRGAGDGVAEDSVTGPRPGACRVVQPRHAPRRRGGHGL